MPSAEEAPANVRSNAACWRTAAVVLFALLNLAIFSIRLSSVWRQGDLFESTGVEYVAIYSVWERLHHMAVYRWPFTYPFSLSIYNYLFYEFYARVLRAMGAVEGGIETWGRALTSVLATVAALVQWRLVCRVLHLRGSEKAVSLVLAVGLWSCTSLVRWWAMSVRPDMGAVAFAMAGLWVVVRRPRFGFAPAGLCFYCAWAFKQSVVFMLFGVCLYLLIERKWRNLAAMLTVFVALVFVTLAAGSEAYRFSTLVAPSLVSGFSVKPALYACAIALLRNFYWLAAPILLFVGKRDKAHNELRVFFVVLAVALAGGFAAMTKAGASDNYLLEAFGAGTILLQAALFRGHAKLATVLVLAGCLQPALQLGGFAVGYQVLGNLQLASAAEYAQARQLRDDLRAMPRPIFLADGILAMPWVEQNGSSGAIVVDPIFQSATHSRQQNGGVEGMLRRGELQTVMLSAQERQYEPGLGSKYRLLRPVRHQGVDYKIYILDRH